MATITFPDRKTEKLALAFLFGRFSGRVLRSGEHLVPEAALEALADQNISFIIKGNTKHRPAKELVDYEDLRYLREAKEAERDAPTIGMAKLKRKMRKRTRNLR